MAMPPEVRTQLARRSRMTARKNRSAGYDNALRTRVPTIAVTGAGYASERRTKAIAAGRSDEITPRSP